MKFAAREIRSQAEMESARSIRMKVFVEGQGVPPDIEMDGYDDVAIHVICLADGRVAGTGRLVELPDGMKLGRVAVLPEFRGRGAGTAIVNWLLARAHGSGHNRVYANVQVSARAFYEKLGFRVEGELFMEAGIEHVRMVRRA